MSDVLIGKIQNIINHAKKVVHGQDDLLESIVIALVCEGHLLIEGMPGLGKTLSVSTMSKLCSLDFKRIQFTPDLLPSDLIGTMIYSPAKEQFTTKFGPIFTQLVLADEINRSPAKVQSALLEAMAEKQVTIGDSTHRLPSPFVVLATQNPIEQEGTYNLPEAQLDRFMMKVLVDYPSFEAEKSIMSLTELDKTGASPIIGKPEIDQIKQAVDAVFVDEKIKDYIVRLVHATRPGSKYYNTKNEGVIVAGASPRATIWLYKIAKYKALMAGRNFVTPEDVVQISSNVLGHRIILSYEALIDKINARSLVKEIAQKVI